MSEQKQINQTVLRVTKGDLTGTEADAFVFYASPDLELGSGFGTAIQMRAGQSVQKELDGIEGKPLPVGEAVVTGAGDLKAKHIIHAVGPRFQEADTEAKLRATVASALKRADDAGIETLALPPMGAGFHGVPLATCVEIMLGQLSQHLSGSTKLKEVTIVTLDSREYEPFRARLASLN
jgi:O-acetyl-ADP-ribose deacetylase (regulator of RNase III)